MPKTATGKMTPGICPDCCGSKGEWVDRKDPRNSTYMQDNDEDEFIPCTRCGGTGTLVTAADDRTLQERAELVEALRECALALERSGDDNFTERRNALTKARAMLARLDGEK